MIRTAREMREETELKRDEVGNRDPQQKNINTNSKNLTKRTKMPFHLKSISRTHDHQNHVFWLFVITKDTTIIWFS